MTTTSLQARKVLMVYLEPTPYIVRLIKELSARWPSSVEVLFVAENLSQEWNIPLHGLSHERLPPGKADAIRRLGEVIGSGDYGVAHLAGWGHPVLLVAMVLARLRNIPLVVETDTPLPYDLPSWKRAIKKLIYPVLFKLPSMFLPGGHRQAVYLRHYGVPDRRISIARMTVDVAAISAYVDAIDAGQRAALRKEFGLGLDETVFLYVGRMEPHKGVDVLLQAFRKLRPTGLSARLLLVGDGALRDKIAGEAGHDAAICYPGRLSGNALLNAYAVADVFVLPSLFEPWGLVVNEAMAAGLSVIASDRAGCVDDLVIPERTGLLVVAGSVESLAAAMQTMLDDTSTRKILASNARSLIAPWTIENKAGNIMKVWSGALS